MTTGAACHDCGLPYGSAAWVEVVVPHGIWNDFLSPTGDEGGLLCINCMARRAVARGFETIPVKLTAGPLREEAALAIDYALGMIDEPMKALRFLDDWRAGFLHRWVDFTASGMSASGQDPKGLEAKPASPTAEGGDAQ